MPILWFSYSSAGYDPLAVIEPLSSPYTITWHVSHLLSEKAAAHGYEFRYVNLDSVEPVTFNPDDIAIGHVWDTPGSFMQQALDATIKAKIVLQPYSHYMVSAGDVQRYIDMFQKADALLFITGEYWYNTMPDSPFAALYPKVTRLDMAVNVEKHPYSKTTWNKPGERAVCVIGHDTPTKGYANVAELARVAGFRLGHFGSGDGASFEHVPCFTAHGGHVFTPDVIQWICREYDAVMAIPSADANPTILLEAAAWGLDVFCSQEAGYIEGQPFRPLYRDNLAFNVKHIRDWQHEDEYNLTLRSQLVRKVVETDYTWSKFCNTIWQKVSEIL